MVAFDEKLIIGGIVAGRVRPSDIALSASDFADDDHAMLLNAAHKLEGQNHAIDAESLLGAFREFDAAGWMSLHILNEYGAMASSAYSVHQAVKRIRDASTKADVTARIETILASDKSGGQIVDELRAIVAGVQQTGTANDFAFLADLADEQKRLYRELHEGVSNSVPTGFPQWDAKLLDGFSKGDAHVIVGMTGSGKSSLALNAALNQAEAGLTVGVVSREMAAHENVMRLQSAKGRIPRWRIRRNMDSATADELERGIERMKDLRIAFNTRSADIETVVTQSRLMKHEHGLDILYVDYLQLLRSEAKHATRANEVQGISRALKELAMELGIPVVSLCQFSRGAVNAPVTELISHLKESSGIEQDASTITLIQTERAEEHTNGLPAAKLTILKNRNGATFSPVHMRFDGEIFSFFEQEATPYGY